MKYIFKLAYKNIINRKKRTILTFAMLSFGIAFYIMMYGMLDGFDIFTFDSMIKNQTGHLKVRSAEFDEDHPFDTDNFIKNGQYLEKVLNKKPFVEKYVPRIIFLAEIDNTQDSLPIIVNAIDAQKDREVFELEKDIDGKLVAGGAVVGVELAKDMEIEKGDIFYLTFRNKQGMLTSIELLTSGIIATTDIQVNAGMIYINLNEAFEYLNSTDVSEYVLITDDLNKSNEYKSILKKALSSFQVVTWEELSEDFAVITRTKRKGADVFLFFIVIIAMVGIINTMIMSVYEKQREIGTMKALGMTDRQVQIMFIIEGFIIGIFGSILGMILGSVFNSYFAISGLDWSAFVGKDAQGMGFNIVGKIKSTWPVYAYISSSILAIAASVLASYFPAKKVLKMQPVDCLRTVQ